LINLLRSNNIALNGGKEKTYFSISPHKNVKANRPSDSSFNNLTGSKWHYIYDSFFTTTRFKYHRDHLFSGEFGFLSEFYFSDWEIYIMCPRHKKTAGVLDSPVILYISLALFGRYQKLLNFRHTLLHKIFATRLFRDFKVHMLLDLVLIISN